MFSNELYTELHVIMLSIENGSKSPKAQNVNNYMNINRYHTDLFCFYFQHKLWPLKFPITNQGFTPKERYRYLEKDRATWPFLRSGFDFPVF